MALIFKCNTGGEQYEAEIVAGKVIYMDGNKRIELESENQDCQSCTEEIEKEANAAKEIARQRVRERKHGQPTTTS